MMDVHLCKCLSLKAHLEALGGASDPQDLGILCPSLPLYSPLCPALWSSWGPGFEEEVGWQESTQMQADISTSSKSPPARRITDSLNGAKPPPTTLHFNCRSLLSSHPCSRVCAQMTSLSLNDFGSPGRGLSGVVHSAGIGKTSQPSWFSFLCL